jgi:hypothetical protein
MRQDVRPVVGLGQGAGPRVEELDRADPGVDLGTQEGERDVGQPVQQRVPQVGFGVHHRLGLEVGARRSALDEIAGQRERRPGETDQRGAAELADEQLDRVGDEADVVRGDRPQPRQVGGGPHRRLDHRSGAGHDVQIDAGGRDRHHDVAEQDRGVDLVPAHRLQGDLGDQIRSAARLEHPDAGPDLAVLGQRSPGLPHEPDRGVRHVEAAAGPHQRRVVQR